MNEYKLKFDETYIPIENNFEFALNILFKSHYVFNLENIVSSHSKSNFLDN
jgi:hypothetical protein